MNDRINEDKMDLNWYYTGSLVQEKIVNYGFKTPNLIKHIDFSELFKKSKSLLDKAKTVQSEINQKYPKKQDIFELIFANNQDNESLKSTVLNIYSQDNYAVKVIALSENEHTGYLFAHFALDKDYGVTSELLKIQLVGEQHVDNKNFIFLIHLRDSTLPIHIHNQNINHQTNLIGVLSGSLRFVTMTNPTSGVKMEQHEIVLHKGDMLMFNPLQLHTGYPIGDEEVYLLSYNLFGKHL